MAGEQNIDYEALAQNALRGIVRSVLQQVAKSGLPGQHHFYIAFNTTASGVSLSSRLKERYPEEMTIVLQHRFRGLLVDEKRFEVELSFDGIPERLVVPFAAIRVFFDPSVPYGLQFEGSDLTADMAQDVGLEGDGLSVAPQVGAVRAGKTDGRGEKKPRSPRKPRAAKGGGEVPKTRAVTTIGADTGRPAKEARSKTVTSKPERPDTPANDTKVIQLDKFRKK